MNRLSLLIGALLMSAPATAQTQPDWTLARLNKVLYHDVRNHAELSEMAGLAELSSNWRELARRRLNSGKTEDWTRRLYGRDAAGR